jgi:hypothetical protein
MKLRVSLLTSELQIEGLPVDFEVDSSGQVTKIRPTGTPPALTVTSPQTPVSGIAGGERPASASTAIPRPMTERPDLKDHAPAAVEATKEKPVAKREPTMKARITSNSRTSRLTENTLGATTTA